MTMTMTMAMAMAMFSGHSLANSAQCGQKQGNANKPLSAAGDEVGSLVTVGRHPSQLRLSNDLILFPSYTPASHLSRCSPIHRTNLGATPLKLPQAVLAHTKALGTAGVCPIMLPESGAAGREIRFHSAPRPLGPQQHSFSLPRFVDCQSVGFPS
jgi:hypothetical protein